MDLDLINWLNSGKYRISFLKLIKKNPIIPSKIAKELDIDRVSVSRILRDLKAEGLISETKKRARTKTIFITEKGSKIVEDLK